MAERQSRQAVDRHRDAKGERHPDKDDQNLIALREANDLRAANDRVDNDESAGEPDGQIQSPAEQGGENNGRRINRDARGEAALNQKQETRLATAFFDRTADPRYS